MKIVVFKNTDLLSKFISNLLVNKIKKNPKSVIGFATGGTFLKTYEYLIKDHQENGTDWSKVTTFNLDEFLGISKKNEQSFYQQMHLNLFNKINVKKANVNILDSQTKNYLKEVIRFEKKIQEYKIDIQLAGVGNNGHIGYNEPPTDENAITRLVDLSKETLDQLLQNKSFATYEEIPKQALTVGPKTLLENTHMVLIAAIGVAKAEIMSRILNGAISPNYPASFMKKHKNAVFLLTQESASKIDFKLINSDYEIVFVNE
ncbi:glucosamine-6-phosphate deaminase [Mycoplasma testudineum]|uniref:Glucosamine-6-phosphate deaminase n=1 Tax=Mycoplasma testudineum TaxID=244584 RepID=A0A4R6IEB0_9MOLU|nr:glucosamine-6-phosphate deaminase [Mycoplasma testudineum]OYD26838.1 glucosamine-6-phosphate deaminase [Mycoplasma testudineum]TDO20372.1 glucosamine-6-phosphate deaminase [Mycoplasma testudineum]